MSKVVKFSEVISKMMEAATLDDKGAMKILDEDAMNEADQMINTMIVEKARDWWAKLESAEDSLADMSDEISFADLNGDASHIGSPAMGIDTDDGQAPASLESMLEGTDFDLDSIFEAADEDEDDEDIDEGMHYEDGEDEFGPEDGDDQFDDLMRGDDDDGLGDDGVDGDLDMGDDMDAIGGEGDFGADDGMGDDLGGDFDFAFLDDEGGEDEFGADDGTGDEFGAEDEFGDDGTGETFRESDDEDEDAKDDEEADKD